MFIWRQPFADKEFDAKDMDLIRRPMPHKWSTLASKKVGIAHKLISAYKIGQICLSLAKDYCHWPGLFYLEKRFQWISITKNVSTNNGPRDSHYWKSIG